jgi:hypothetical protein
MDEYHVKKRECL